ncbi:MAG TPA: hypothetical protein VGM18_19015 [Candidatus Sulfotelmatobacter sp.]
MRIFFDRLFIVALIFCCGLMASVPTAGQTASPSVPLGIVSDWTQHHILFPDASDAAEQAEIQREPRWLQNWYLRHPEAWWPQSHPVNQKARTKRDWSVALGLAYFEPLFDSTYTFGITAQTGNGTLTSTNLGGGELLVTAGTLNVTGGSDIGSYTLHPGGPGVTVSPAGAFDYDDLFFPAANPTLDGYGLLFTGGGTEVNIWGNSASNYSFYSFAGGVYTVEITSAGFFTPGVSSGPDPGGGQMFPAKYVFNVKSAPSCANDFVVIGIPTSGSSTQANILGLNNLYSNSSGTGFCPTTGPTVKFAYASGTGQVPASLVISQSGKQIAYVENLSGSSYFHCLTLGSTGTNGTGATAPVVPGAGGGNNAVDNRVLLSPDGGVTNQGSTNAPFILYTGADFRDVAYVTSYSTAGVGSGYLYKISNVFNGSVPTIVWSAPITAIPSTPVYDQVSNKVFFTDSSGRIDYVVDSGAAPSVVYGPVVASGTTSENPVVIDSTHQMVYASFNSNGTHAIVVQTPTSMASSVSVAVGTKTTTYTGPYLPDFNNSFYTGGTTPPPMMFVAGTGTGTLPTLYGVGFTGGVMNSTVSNSAALATGTADSSPVSEFYNSTLAKDFLFVGVTNNCVATKLGGTGGCIMSLDITSGFPTINANTTALAATGGTSGIIPDNNSNLSQASSVYYTTKTGATLVKATQSALQ